MMARNSAKAKLDAMVAEQETEYALRAQFKPRAPGSSPLIGSKDGIRDLLARFGEECGFPSISEGLFVAYVTHAARCGLQRSGKAKGAQLDSLELCEASRCLTPPGSTRGRARPIEFCPDKIWHKNAISRRGGNLATFQFGQRWVFPVLFLG
jgi:hypothetical protein